MTRAPIVLALVVSAIAAAAAPPPLTRAQALTALSKPEMEARREAAAWLGDLGVMADTAPLVRALRDDDDVVRILAERSLWKIWSRSGDPEIDALFAAGRGARCSAAPPPPRSAPSPRSSRRSRTSRRAGTSGQPSTTWSASTRKSLRDCDEVLKRNPDHWGALAGYGQIYIALDEPERALDYFQRALRVNPNLRSVEAAVAELKRIIIEKRKGVI